MLNIKNLSVLLFTSTLIFSGLAQADFDWQLKKEDSKQNIKIYLSEVEGSNLKAFKSVTEIKAPLSNFVAMLDKVELHTKWMHNCIEAKTLQPINRMERVSYNVTKTPWPVKNREVVVYTKIAQDPATLAITIDIAAKPDQFPMETKNVRMPKLDGFWKFTPKDNGVVEVVYQVHADPGGSIPAWLANAIVVETPLETLKNMHNQINNESYQNQSYPELEMPSTN